MATKKTEDKAVAVIEQEINPLIVEAGKIVVKDEKSKERATIVLSELNKIIDRAEDEKQKVLGPLNQARAAELARWKPLESRFKPAKDELRAKLGTYQTEELERANIEADKIAARTGVGKGKFSLETAAKKMDEVEMPSTVTRTDSGKLSFMPKDTLEVTDASLIPDGFWLLDEKGLLDALKVGTVVPGARIKVIQVPRNSR